MSTFLSKLKPSAAAANATNNLSPNKKKDEPVPEQTPLEKMLLNAGPVREDGTDKFFGLENFGNTCYCNSILQALYHSESFRNNVVQFPPYSPADTPNGKPRKVNVQIRKPIETVTTPAPGTATATTLATTKKPLVPQQQFKQRPPTSPGQPPLGPQPVRPEDKPDTPEYKKKQAMIKGPVLDLTDNANAYGMDESTFTSVKDIFMAFIESTSRTGVLSPHRLLEIFRKENELFRTAMHQDAHEFYGLVLNDIIKTVEVAAVKRQQIDEDKDGLKKSVQAALGNGQTTGALVDGTSTPGSGWVHDIFEGVLTSETRCLTCESSSQRDETFLDLSIDLEEHSSVTSCLRKFSAEEMLCERNKFHCDHCGGLQEAEKRMKIKRLPKILALHLKRFKYSEDYTKLEKLFHRVVYPYQLRMFNTTDEAQDPDRLYELYAVVVHIGGNAYHGHYVSVIKTKERGWLLFDDEMVEPVDKHFVRNFFGDQPGTACAYVLFYQETTFEKMQAEQELEGLAEIKLANQSAGMYLEPEEQQERSKATNGAGLFRQVTQPLAVSPSADMRDGFVGLQHATTAPGAVLTPISSVPPVPAALAGAGAGAAAGDPPHAAANAKLEAARLKEEREREKKEAKAADKARKAQEKENAKELERQRKEREREREAQRKAEAEEMRRVIAMSKQSAADEKDAHKNSMDGGTSGSGSGSLSVSASKSSGFLSRSARGSKSMSRKSFAFLGKDKDKEREKLPTLPSTPVPESPFAPDVQHHASSSNGAAVNGNSVASAPIAIAGPPRPIEHTAQYGASPGASSSYPAGQAESPTQPPPPPAQQAHDKHTSRKERFSFSLGRKKSNTFLP